MRRGKPKTSQLAQIIEDSRGPEQRAKHSTHTHTRHNIQLFLLLLLTVTVAVAAAAAVVVVAAAAPAIFHIQILKMHRVL